MGKDKNGDDEPNPKDLSPRQKLLRIMQIVSQPERTDQELEEMLFAMEKIIARKKDK